MGIKVLNKSNDGDAVVWYSNGIMVQSSTFYEKSLTLISNEEFLTKIDLFSNEIKPIYFHLNSLSNEGGSNHSIYADYYYKTIKVDEFKCNFELIDALKNIIDNENY